MKVCGEGEMVGSWFQPNDANKVALIVGDKVSLIDLGQGAQPSKVRCLCTNVFTSREKPLLDSFGPSIGYGFQKSR